MSTEVDNLTRSGVGGSFNWLVGGAVGGAIGSLLFGAVLWLLDPTIITDAIPAIYGLETAGTAGWLFHLGHGLILGTVFGFLITRNPILGALMADVETDFLAAMGPVLRLTLAGLVYGLAVWTVLPVIVLPIWAAIGIGEAGFPALAFEGLVGHLLYGLLLGALFALIVDLEPAVDAVNDPFAESD